jgi:hypothetical protein
MARVSLQEKPGFGFPAGGSSDTRFTAYFEDQWKLLSKSDAASIGVRYVRDTGRTDSDIDPIPALHPSSIALAICSISSVQGWWTHPSAQ